MCGNVMAKRAAKKTKKKSPVKKQTKAKSKKAVKKTSSNKSGLLPLPPLKTCLKGKRIALAGRFSYPDKKPIEAFFKSCGAKIATAIDGKLDVLLVGEGRKPAAQTKAEKLNAKGDADILITDQAIVAIPDFELNLVEYLTSPDQFGPFCNIVEKNWLFHHSLREIDGVDFSKKTIGSDYLSKGRETAELELDFHNCSFDRATIHNTTIGTFRGESSGCEFNGTIFDNANLRSPNQCTFNKCKGSCLDLSFPQDCQLDGMSLDKFELYLAKKIDISNSKFKVLNISSSGEDLEKCTLHNVKIGMLEAEGCDILSSKFSKVTIAATDLGGKLKCVGSTFKDCKFSNLESESIEFIKCELINCTFDSLKTDNLSFGEKTKLKNCRFVKPNISQISASETQLAGTKGLPKTIKQFTPKTHPNLYSLAKTIVKSDRFQLTFDAVYQKTKTVRLSCLSQYGTDFSFVCSAEKQHKGKSEVSCFRNPTQVSETFRNLGWWITASKASDINLGTIALKTSKSPLKGKALKELVIAAIFEGMGTEPRSAEEIKSAGKESSAKSTAIKKAVKAELIAGDIKKLNKRPASERMLASPLRKADFSNANLSGAKLVGFKFRGCNFSGANLSKVNFSQGAATSCDFTNANLKEAKLANCDLSNSVLNEADATKAVLSGAVLTKAKMNKTNFTNANFSVKKSEYHCFHAYQPDLSTCNLKGANFANCTFDEKTRLPANFPKAMRKKMEWCGPGLPPDQRKHLKKAAGPLDFDTFMERLTEITDASRLKKSLKMLKADSFELFSEVEDDRVAGVVKSQSDAKLVYSCTLQQSGEFSCCTQNLNPCGGLRGSLCKHILVLLVGLAKSGELDPTKGRPMDQRQQTEKPRTGQGPHGRSPLKIQRCRSRRN